jgi:hypothetical protein
MNNKFELKGTGKFRLISAATVVVAALFLTWQAAHADLVVTEVMSSSSHTNSQANGDWWELYNSGPLAIDLTGYSWDDNTATAGSADFNGATIGAGQAIIICQENVGSEQAWLDAWGLSGVTVINLGNSEFQNFSGSGDEVHVYNPSLLEIAAVSFETATTGHSFVWNSAGVSLGLSVLDVDGAFQATELAGGGPDIGSPGYASVVPEPGVMALLAMGAFGVAAGRRHLRR